MTREKEKDKRNKGEVRFLSPGLKLELCLPGFEMTIFKSGYDINEDG